MVEEDAADGVEAVGLAVVHRDPVPVDLGDAVGRARIEGGGLPLGRLGHLAEHLRARRLVEPGLRVGQADGLEDPGDAEGRELAGQDRLGPRGGHVGLGRQVVDLVRPGLLQGHGQRMLVEQVGRHDRQPVGEVVDPLAAVVAGPADDAEDLVVLGQQQFGQVGPVLAGDPGDQRAPALSHGALPGVVVSRHSRG